MVGEDRRITSFVDTGPQPDEVHDGRAESDDVDDRDQDTDAAEECEECGSPNVAYSDASAASESLPEKALCRKCILDLL